MVDRRKYVKSNFRLGALPGLYPIAESVYVNLHRTFVLTRLNDAAEQQ